MRRECSHFIVLENTGKAEVFLAPTALFLSLPVPPELPAPLGSSPGGSWVEALAVGHERGKALLQCSVLPQAGT